MWYRSTISWFRSMAVARRPLDVSEINEAMTIGSARCDNKRLKVIAKSDDAMKGHDGQEPAVRGHGDMDERGRVLRKIRIARTQRVIAHTWTLLLGF